MRRGYLPNVKLLARAGAEVTIKNEKGDSPLKLAKDEIKQFLSAKEMKDGVPYDNFVWITDQQHIDGKRQLKLKKFKAYVYTTSI